MGAGVNGVAGQLAAYLAVQVLKQLGEIALILHPSSVVVNAMESIV